MITTGPLGSTKCLSLSRSHNTSTLKQHFAFDEHPVQQIWRSATTVWTGWINLNRRGRLLQWNPQIAKMWSKYWFKKICTSRRWVWSRGMLSTPLQAEETLACKTIGNRNYLSYCEQGLEECGSEPNTSKCKRRIYSFSTRILTKLFEIKQEVFFFLWHKEGGGHRSFAVTRKALVHSGDVTLNIRFFKVGKRWLYSSHGFLGGHVAQAARRLARGSTARVRSRVLEGWRFPSLIPIQTAPGVHSAYYKRVPERWTSAVAVYK